MKLTNYIMAAVYPRAGEGVSPGTSFRSSAEVYPRVRGVNAPCGSSSPVSGGLSPRTRGKHTINMHDEVDEGSIPVCAGEPARSFCAGPGSRSIPAHAGGMRLTASTAR
jgi:hypothetical protein